jgi:ABC-type ATPase involved in cell division
MSLRPPGADFRARRERHRPSGERSVGAEAANRHRVFRDFRLLDHLTTWENVALPLRVMGKKEPDYMKM